MIWLRNIARGLLVFSVVLAAGQAVQEKPQAPAQTPAAQNNATVSASEQKPSPQIEKLLKSLGGVWSIRESLAPQAPSSNGVTGKGEIVWRRGPGGFSVIEDYRSRQGSQDITGMGVFWWDEAAQGYRTIWCDSTNPGGCISFKNVVRWDGTELSLVENYESNGKKFTFKEVFNNVTPGTFTQTLYGGESGKDLKVDQTIEATRSTSETPK